MNTAPDDILHLVFHAYVNWLGCSPATPLRVNWHWNGIVSSTKALWTRINIHIDSFDTIPTVTSPKNPEGDETSAPSNSISPLRSYLDRSFTSEGSVSPPLDIFITFYGFPEKHNNRRWKDWEITKQTKDQLWTLLTHLAGLRSDRMPIGTTNSGHEEEKKDYLRWRSISFDGQAWNPFWPAIFTGFQPLKHRGCNFLPLLESVSCKNVHFNFDRVELPRLMSINAEASQLFSIPRDCKVQNLTFIKDEADGLGYRLPCEKFIHLQRLEIKQMSLLLSRVFAFRSLPKTVVEILFEDHIVFEMLFMVLASFKTENPLKLLGMSPRSIAEMFTDLDEFPSLPLRSIAISARQLEHRPKKFELWDWGTYGNATWEMPSKELIAMNKLLTKMESWDIRVVALDAQIQAMIDDSRTVWDDNEGERDNE